MSPAVKVESAKHFPPLTLPSRLVVSDSGGTIARHGAENINGAAANITLGATDKWSVLAVRCNGTDWIIKGGTTV